MGSFLRLSSTGAPRQYAEAAAFTIYDQEVLVGGSGLTTGSPLSLPSGQTYLDGQLEVFLNGQALMPVSDYSYYGGSPYTQVSFPFNLASTDLLRFRIARAA